MQTADLVPINSRSLDYARRFSAALLSPDLPAPDGVAGPRGKKAERRYDVYRNNVTVSLIDALASIFPAVQRITGPDFFRAMARFHIRETPPQSPLLFEYGKDFPGFIERYEHAQDMPWLADVARIERSWLDSYHAADAPALDAQVLTAIPHEKLGDVRFKPHPATRTISSAFPAVTIFAMNRGADPVGRVDNRPECGLITRVDDDVAIRLLPRGSTTFLNALIAGETLAAAVAAGIDSDNEFDLATAIGEMFAAGAFSQIETEFSNV
jgi:hypothetical protein